MPWQKDIMSMGDGKEQRGSLGNIAYFGVYHVKFRSINKIIWKYH